MNPIRHFQRVLIVEDDGVLRRSLVRVARTFCDSTDEAATIAQGLRLLECRPDLVLADVRLPDGSARDIARAAARLSPPPMLVAMSGCADPAESFELAQLGVHLYLPKPFSAAELRERIEDVLQEAEIGGEMPWPEAFSTEDRQRLLFRLRRFASTHKLSKREVELIRLSISDTPRAEYAALLGISDNTCKTTVRRLLSKCGARRLADIPRLLLVRGRA